MSAGSLVTAAQAGGDERVAAFLRDRHGAAADRIRVVPLTGDASTRRYFRLHDGAATSVLALHPEPFDVDTLPFVVVRGLLAGWGVPVPSLLDADGSRGILVVEDLGERSLQDALASASGEEREAWYDEAVGRLVHVQRAAAAGPTQAACFGLSFDVGKLGWELHYFQKHFLEGSRARELSGEDRGTLARAFHDLVAEIASWPRVLCHRDFHSRNLMLHSGALHWIDFQDARMGPVTYDIASLLRDSYVDVPEDLVARRLETFRREAAGDERPDAFGRRFDLTCVQRNLKALGTFGYMASVAGKSMYLAYVPRTLAAVKRNLARYPELAELAGVLRKHVEELRES